MLVEVVDVLDHAAFPGAADGDVVEHRQVLDELAEADAAGVRADRDAELRREQEDRDVLVDAPDAARVELQDVDRPAWSICLKRTRLCDVLPVATRTGATAARIAAWPRMSSGLVGSSIQYGW